MLDKKGIVCYNQKELTFFPNLKKEDVPRKLTGNGK